MPWKPSQPAMKSQSTRSASPCTLKRTYGRCDAMSIGCTSSASVMTGPPPMIATCVRKSARAGDAARLQERFERLAAERGHHLRVRHALDAREFLEAEEARAVVLHRLPVQAPHHVALFGGQVFHRGIGVALEKLAHLLAREAVQEAVEPQALGASFQIKDVAQARC